MEQEIRKLIEEFVNELLEILKPAIQKEENPKNSDNLNLAAFFNTIRKPLFGRLTKTQVSGHEDIIQEMRKRKVPLAWAAYILATAYHETAKTMQPVKEGLRASEAWRRKNLRYYPWYGRGHVQLTWRENYEKADRLLGLGGLLTQNPDAALDPEVSVQVLVQGMIDGWFSGDGRGRHTLERHIKNKDNGTFEEFKNARRIVNLMDKASLIANYAMVYQQALKAANY